MSHETQNWDPPLRSWLGHDLWLIRTAYKYLLLCKIFKKSCRLVREKNAIFVFFGLFEVWTWSLMMIQTYDFKLRLGTQHGLFIATFDYSNDGSKILLEKIITFCNTYDVTITSWLIHNVVVKSLVFDKVLRNDKKHLKEVIIMWSLMLEPRYSDKVRRWRFLFEFWRSWSRAKSRQ